MRSAFCIVLSLVLISGLFFLICLLRASLTESEASADALRAVPRDLEVLLLGRRGVGRRELAERGADRGADIDRMARAALYVPQGDFPEGVEGGGDI